jgi:hypothetical protein
MRSTQQERLPTRTEARTIALHKTKVANLVSLHLDATYAKEVVSALRVTTSVEKLVIVHNIMDEDIAEMLKKSLAANRSINCLELHGIKLNSWDLFNICQGVQANSGITSLTLKEVGFSKNAIVILADELSSCSGLRSLTLNNVDVNRTQVSELLRAISSMTNLSKLTIEDSWASGDLINSIPRSGITVSLIGGCQIDDNDLRAMALAESEGVVFDELSLKVDEMTTGGSIALDVLAESRNLTKLILKSAASPYPSSIALSTALPLTARLTYLELEQDFTATTSGAMELFQGVAISPTLATLILSGQLDRTAIEHLSQAISVTNKTRILKITKAALAEDHMIEIFNAMAVNHSIITLGLPEAQTTDNSLLALRELLKITTTIHSLQIPVEGVSRKGMIALTEGIKGNSSLELLAFTKKFYKWMQFDSAKLTFQQARKSHPTLVKLEGIDEDNNRFQVDKLKSIYAQLQALVKYETSHTFSKNLPTIEGCERFHKLLTHQASFYNGLKESNLKENLYSIISPFFLKKQYIHPDHYFLLGRICKKWQEAKYCDYSKTKERAATPLSWLKSSVFKKGAVTSKNAAEMDKLAVADASSIDPGFQDFIENFDHHECYSNISMLPAEVWEIIIGYAIE